MPQTFCEPTQSQQESDQQAWVARLFARTPTSDFDWSVRSADIDPDENDGALSSSQCSPAIRARLKLWLTLGTQQVVPHEVDQLDAKEGQHHVAEPVEKQVAAQERGRADGSVTDAFDGKWDEGRDDQGRALKMAAELMALLGSPRCITLRSVQGQRPLRPCCHEPHVKQSPSSLRLGEAGAALPHLNADGAYFTRPLRRSS